MVHIVTTSGRADRLLDRANPHVWPQRRIRRVLLAAGVATAGVYAVGDVVSGLRYRGYSFKGQAISELSAYGSPVRRQMVAFLTVHDALLVLFGGVLWRAARGNRALQGTAALLLAAAGVTLPIHPYFPMSSRWMKAGFNDAVHMDVTIAFGLLVSGAVVASGAASHGWFRLYAATSALTMAVFGGTAGSSSRALANDAATPWLGAAERINAYVYLAWIVALAIAISTGATDGPAPGDHDVRL